MQIQTVGASRTMSTREIAELTGKQVGHVNRDAAAMLADLAGTDDPELEHVHHEKDSRGYLTAIHLPHQLSMTLVSGYSTPLRRRIVQRWQELEAGAIPALPRTFSEALRALADKTDEAEKQAAALALAAPKVAMVDRYIDSSGTQTFRQVAKLLQAKEPAFRGFLAAHRIMYQLSGEWVPYAEHLDAGRFVVKTGSAENGHSFSAARFTPKGIAWVSELWDSARK